VSTQTQSTAAHTALGIGLMLAGVFLFTLNDALGKWLVASYSVAEILLIRSAIGIVLLLPLIGRAGTTAFTTAPHPWLQVARVALSVTEVAAFFLALRYLPLADAITFYLAGPIYVTALSVVMLGERVGWRRWTAVCVGFVGVVVALRPSGDSLTWPALIALAGSIIYAVFMTVTRALRETHNTVLVTGQVIGTLIFGLVAAPFVWVTPALNDVALLGLFGATAVAALFCVNRSLTLAPASVVVPYQYTMIVWGALLGYLVFGDVPSLNVFIGATIIVAAGLYIFVREQTRRM
jgi:drug/metabolite transporter (DMT)-like permease